MDTRDIIQLLSLVFAFLSIPPALSLTRYLSKEKKLVGEVSQRKLNDITRLMFSSVGVMSLLNALISIMSIFDFGILAHNLSPIFRLISSLSLATISWLMEAFRKRLANK